MEHDRIREEIIMIVNDITGSKNKYTQIHIPLEMDSIDFVRTLLEIEMRYDIELQEDDLIIDKYKTIDDLVELVKQFKKG